MINIPGTGYSLGLSGVDGKPDVVPEESIFLDQVHGDNVRPEPTANFSGFFFGNFRVLV